MRKQIVNLLTVAMLALTVGTIFSSCKDYDDEIYADLKGQIVDMNSTLSDLINAQGEDLIELRDSLNKAKERCDDRLNKVNTSLKNKQDSIVALDNRIKALEADTANYATKVELEKAKNALNDSIDALETELKGMIADLATKSELNAAIESVNEKIQTNLDSINSFYGQITTINNNYTTIKNTVSTLEGRVGTLESNMILKSDFLNVQTTANNAKAKADANKVSIDSLGDLIDKIKSCACIDLTDRLTNIDTKLKNDSIRLNGIDEDIAEVNERIDNLKMDSVINAEITKIAGVTEEGATVPTIKDLNDAYQKADQVATDSIDALREKLNELTERLDSTINSLKDEIADVKDALNKRISSVVLQGAYSPVVGYFALPTGVKSNILAAYYGMPMFDVNFPTASTIRYVDATVVFDERTMELLGFDENDGSFSAGVSYPANQPLVADTANAGKLYMTINPNDVDLSGTTFKLVNSLGEESSAVLGEAKKSSDKLTFGYTRAGADNGFYEITANIASDKAQDATVRINKNDIKDIVNEFKNFSNGININDVATKLYSVINDIADANAIEATWTDSLGEHSVYSDYGIAAVSVEPLSYNFMKDVNMTSFPGLNRVSNLVNNIIDKVNISIPDFGIGEIKVPEISKIEIKDLSPELLAKFNITITKTVEYELDLDVPVDDVIVKGQNINVPGTVVVVPAQKITVPSREIDVVFSDGTTGKTTIPAQQVNVPEQEVTVDGKTVWVEGQTIKIPNVKYKDTLYIPVEVSYDMRDAVEDLYGEMTGSIEDVNKMLGELEEFMDDINNILSDLKKIEDIETSIVDAKDKIKSELNKYIDKLNNKLCNLVNSINGKMQPTMLVKTTDGFSMLSTIKAKPSVFNAEDAILVPTSFNAEILAPAFKKYIAVSNVINAETGANAYDGDATCVSALKAANSGDLNKVLEGSTREVSFNGQAGYIYEIVYSAVDYDGFISNSKYYVKIQ